MKNKTVFACQECGAQSQKWLGRCPECGAWNSLVEERAAEAPAAADIAKRYSLAMTTGPQLYADIDTMVAERLTTGIDEFDRVLGGGVVPGSLVLIGGEPGIGKSTLLLQAAAHFARTYGPVLYSSGEESEHQIKSRGERLGIERAPLYILAETCLERILEACPVQDHPRAVSFRRVYLGGRRAFGHHDRRLHPQQGRCVRHPLRVVPR